MPDESHQLSRPTPWREVVIICRKCGKKLDGGFGPKRRQSLKVLLRQALRDRGQRRTVQVFETGCMGLCPKQGVTALNATSPGAIHVIPAGMPADDAVDILLGGHVVADLGGIEAP